ncbi:MAG: Chloramphenicol acetyltransferase 2 [Desulfovibrio sp.]
MNTYRVIDKTTWPRRELFEFYQGFENPCLNVSVSLEAQNLYACAKGKGESFFLLALYAILRAANAVPQVRQRVVGGEPVEFDRIAAMTPIMTDQEMFHQAWCEYAPTYAAFAEQATPAVAAARKGAPGPLLNHGEDFLCASCLPWLHFTSVTQAEYAFGQAIPILAWGKLQNGHIPISCKFNHAFMDGLHISRFFRHIAEAFSAPETLWETL